MRRRSFVGRPALASAVALSAVVGFAAVGGTGLAGSLAKPGKAQYGGQYNNAAKVWVCHRKGNGGSVTIRVSLKAWPAHQKHGDTQGLCATLAASGAKAKKAKQAKGETTETTTPSSGKSKSGNGKAKGKNK